MHAGLTRLLRVAVLAGVSGLGLGGCGAGQGPGRAGGGSLAQGSACEAFDTLEDAWVSLQTSATFGRSSDLFYLVDIDEDLGYLHVAEKALAHATSPAARALGTQMGDLSARLARVRERVGVAFVALEKTGEAAEAALDEAATCQGADLRDLSRPAGSPLHAKVDPVTREKTLRANEAKAASKACESMQRLWAAARGTDLTSAITSSSIAAHIVELTLPGTTGHVRDQLAAALTEHAKALKHFNAIAGAPDPADAEIQALTALRGDVIKAVDERSRACRSQLGDVGRIVGGEPEPRRATVTVRPKWPDALASFSHPVEFGSGFVVRWRGANGQVEARVVTNNHVMDGAFEAEIVAGDPRLAKPMDLASEKVPTWSATLVEANPHDDVAVLRLDPDAQRVFAEGFTFRLVPAREEEAVAAAGFPGIGARPSFQVTKGTVSNARFSTDGAGTNALDVYVQHTAAIDPGNSGGPLLDARGRLLGMNTFKLVGRENVGMAIPTWRIEEALERADESVSLDTKHAEASCNAVVAALASSHPVGSAASRFGLALYDWAQARPSVTEAASYSEQMQEGLGNPVDDARRRAYGTVRAEVEQEGGVRPFEACSLVHAGDSGSIVGTFHTRRGVHTLTLREEHAVMRVVAFQ